MKPLETAEEIQARVKDANTFMLDNDCDFLTALNTVEEGTLAKDEPRTVRGPLVGPVTLG